MLKEVPVNCITSLILLVRFSAAMCFSILHKISVARFAHPCRLHTAHSNGVMQLEIVFRNELSFYVVVGQGPLLAFPEYFPFSSYS